MTIDDAIKGLTILKRHSNSRSCLTAEHDQVWCHTFGTPDSGERAELERLGWFFDEDVGAWSFST
jgi:hypothetical protein